jgi:hypothetical protein
MPKTNNEWVTHVKQYQKKHNVTYKEAMTHAKSTYRQTGDGIIQDTVRNALGWVEAKTGSQHNLLLPKHVQKWLTEYGSSPIKTVQMFKTPIDKIGQNLIKAVSLGRVSENLKGLKIDDILHFGVIINLENGKHFMVERNARLNVTDHFPYQGAERSSEVPAGGITVGKLFENFKNSLPHKSYNDILFYDPITNNCIVFSRSLLNASGLLTTELRHFSDLPVMEILKGSPKTKATIDNVTSLGLLV